jgi:hypothetical protein
MSVVIRDSSDPAITSAVVKLDSVNVDATAPVLSSVVGVSTGETSVSWGVTSDEAMGTTYAGIRLATDAAITASQLIAESGGTGIAFDNDEMSADAGNNGNFSGLTANTGYVIDTVAVDDWGNVSNVASSATVTTDAAASGPLISFVSQHNFAGGTGSSGEYTISGVTLGTSGEVYVAVAGSTAGDPLTVTMTVDGVSATQEVLGANGAGRNVAGVFSAPVTSATGDIVVTFSTGNLSDGGAIWVYKADASLTVTDTATGVESETNPTPPEDIDLSLNVAANGSVIAVGSNLGGSDTVWDRFTGVSEDGTQYDADSGDVVVAASAHELSAATPRTVSIGFGLENPTFIAAAAISLES